MYIINRIAESPTPNSLLFKPLFAGDSVCEPAAKESAPDHDHLWVLATAVMTLPRAAVDPPSRPLLQKRDHEACSYSAGFS